MARGLGNLQSAVLTTLQIAGIVGLAVLAPNAIQILEQFGLTDVRRKRLRYEIPKTVRVLERKKLIQRASHGYCLTELGRQTLNLNIVQPLPRPKKWDGKWRLIIFDIPVNKTRSRNRLRTLIRTYGFVELQQSVWIYPYPCENLVEILKIELSLGDELQYLVAQSFEGDTDLRGRFEIK